MAAPVFLRSMQIIRYRSIADETLRFENPQFLVGRNATGKSNLLDVISFVSDAMRLPLSAVFEKHGGLGYVVARDEAEDPQVFREPIAIRLDFTIPDEGVASGTYSFAIPDSWIDWWDTPKEHCELQYQDGETVWFRRMNKDSFETSVGGVLPSLSPESLALPLVGGHARFAPLVRALAAMRVYSFSPERMRLIQHPSLGAILAEDGSNIATVLRDISRNNPHFLTRLCELMRPILPGIDSIEPVVVKGGSLAIAFKQQGREFDAASMSDGTLRALALITATFQKSASSLVAFEEPETSLHVGSLGVIGEALRNASETAQVVVTTHSPELLDEKWIKPENVKVVHWDERGTRIAELTPFVHDAVRQHLMGLGGLVRASALDFTPANDASEPHAVAPAVGNA